MKYKVITISREFGSGGHNIGEMIAEKLGYDFLDTAIVEKIAQESGLGKETIERIGEERSNKKKSILSMLKTDVEQEFTDEIFIKQREVICSAAKIGHCVIVGRCSDYILKDNPNVLNVFIYADMSSKIDRIAKLHELTLDDSEALILKKSESRKAYYEFYTDQTWANVQNFDICLNSSRLGLDECVKAIVDYVKD